MYLYFILVTSAKKTSGKGPTTSFLETTSPFLFLLLPGLLRLKREPQCGGEELLEELFCIKNIGHFGVMILG